MKIQELKKIFNKYKKIFYVATPLVLTLAAFTTMIFHIPFVYAATLPPTNFKIISVTPNINDKTKYDVKLGWDAVNGASFYTVKASLATGGPYAAVPPTSMTATTATYAAVSPGIFYDVVTETASNVESPPSNEVTLIIPPSNLKLATMVPNGQNKDVTLTWDAVPGADSYTILASSTAGGPYAPIFPITTTNSETFLNVAPGTYYDVVVATKGNVTSFPSAELKAVVPAAATPPPPPPAPTPTPPPASSDSDNDGIPDSQDMCANTPSGTAVGADGCPNTSGGTGNDPLSESEQALIPAPDIVSCQIVNPTVVLSENKITLVRCKLKPPAYITVWIIKGDYTPPEDPDPTAVVKTLAFQKPTSDFGFTYSWDGVDNYDSKVEEGDYTFVVKAQQNTTDKPDISLQKIKVIQDEPIQTQEQTQEVTPAPTPEPPARPAAPPTPPPPPPAPPVPSKCPGVNYPNDIANHWAKDFINVGYDYCIFSGYADGSFHPDGNISRAEAVKAVLVAAGISPKLGCYDLDCGTPFVDLISWQSPWIRGAWDNKIVKGVSATLFAPQRPITRGEAIVLIAKAYKIPPHKNCYTPACGSGYPYNFFLDITDSVQGSYLRALWDKGIIKGTGPNAFTPNRFLTRAEMATLIIKIGEVLGKIHASGSQTTSTQTSQTTKTTTTTQSSTQALTTSGSAPNSQTTGTQTNSSTQTSVQSTSVDPYGTSQSSTEQVVTKQ